MHSESSNSEPKQPSEPQTVPPSAPQTNSDDSKSSAQPSPSSKEQASSEEHKLPRGLVEKGAFNEQLIAIGRRGSGKSQWCLARCLDFAKIPAYVVAHDLGWKIPDRLHDGRRTFVRRFSSAAEARSAFARDPRGIFAISSQSCDEVLDFATEVAEHSLERHGGTHGHPCILYIEEVVSAEICDPHYLDPKFKQVMAESRHRNIGIVAGVQSARILHNILLTMATHVELFSITDRRDHKRLIECGVDEETVLKAAHLPPHKSISVRL